MLLLDLNRQALNRRKTAQEHARQKQPIFSDYTESGFFNSSRKLGQFYLFLNLYKYRECSLIDLYRVYSVISEDGWFLSKGKLRNQYFELFTRQSYIWIERNLNNNNSNFLRAYDNSCGSIYLDVLKLMKSNKDKGFAPLMDFQSFTEVLSYCSLEALFNNREIDYQTMLFYLSSPTYTPHKECLLKSPSQLTLINVPCFELICEEILIFGILEKQKQIENRYVVKSRSLARKSILNFNYEIPFI